MSVCLSQGTQIEASVWRDLADRCYDVLEEGKASDYLCPALPFILLLLPLRLTLLTFVQHGTAAQHACQHQAEQPHRIPFIKWGIPGFMSRSDQLILLTRYTPVCLLYGLGLSMHTVRLVLTDVRMFEWHSAW